MKNQSVGKLILARQFFAFDQYEKSVFDTFTSSILSTLWDFILRFQARNCTFQFYAQFAVIYINIESDVSIMGERCFLHFYTSTVLNCMSAENYRKSMRSASLMCVLYCRNLFQWKSQGMLSAFLVAFIDTCSRRNICFY